MSLFFVTFFLAYAGMHGYAFLKARAALRFGPVPGMMLALFMLAMVFAPVLIRQSEKHGLEILARILSWSGYTWLGILFLFFSASLTVDLYRLLVRAAEFLGRNDYSHLRPSPSVAFYLPLVAAVLIAGYGYGEARNIRTERITMKSRKIPESAGSLKIVQISDVHLGLIIRQERLRRILDIVKTVKPDIFVVTGDLVDGQINDMPGLAEMFDEIRPPLGKYAITGNHEFYAGLNQALSFTQKAGFTVLRGDAVTVGGLLNIAGVDDPAGRNLGLHKAADERMLLSGVPKEKFTLLLKHRPLIDKDAAGLFDLQLSGHVHKGQIFPFSIATRLYYPVDSGLARIAEGGYLYVSRGTGTWGPPIRFLSPPEVTVIEVEAEGAP